MGGAVMRFLREGGKGSHLDPSTSRENEGWEGENMGDLFWG